LNSLKAIKAQAKASEKRRFFCRADAEAAANEILVQETAYHRLKLRVIEHAMRLGLEARNAMLPGWDNKPTRRPSAYMMTWKFKGVIVLCVGQQRHLAQPLSPVQKAFLRALQVPEHYFTHPPRSS
jgi:hypothetical protein